MDFYPYSFFLGLPILIFAIIRLRKRGWRYLLGVILFGFYLMWLAGIALSPFHVPEDFPANLNYSQLAAALAARINLIPFNYGNMFSDVFSGRLPAIIAYEQILGNIVVTIPFGFGMTALAGWHGWKAVWMALSIGFALEASQLLMVVVLESPHAVDINDVLTNALGAMVGYGLYLAAEKSARILRA